jgi:hypothetical protein
LPPPPDIKYKRAMASDFSKSKGQSLDEYLLENVKCTIKENAYQQVYVPNYEFLKKPLGSNVPAFEKIVSR